jgi:hypothetical protein
LNEVARREALLGGAHADRRQDLLDGKFKHEVAGAVEACENALQLRAATQASTTRNIRRSAG